MATEPYIKVTSYEQAEALLQYGHCIFLGYDPCVIVIEVAPKVFSVTFIRDNRQVKHEYYTIEFFKEAYDICMSSDEQIYSIKVPQHVMDEEQRSWIKNKRWYVNEK